MSTPVTNVTTIAINGAPFIPGLTRTTNCDTVISIDDTIAANTTNQHYSVSAPIAKQIVNGCTCDVAVTIKLNSTGSPDVTINLPAGGYWYWDLASSGASINPLGVTNTTDVYVTTGAAAATAFRFLVGLVQP
jgi:hypothetical protein